MTEEQKNKCAHLIGKRVYIQAKDHPWYDEVGRIKEFDTMAGKFACVVKLDNGIECVVFNGNELKYL